MSSTALKLLALMLMFIDHIGEFIPGIPIWFRWIGRISAPLFLFCMVWGFHYTHDRKKYLLRMYGFGVMMAIIDTILNNIFRNPYKEVTNNIFVTLFLVGVVVWIIEYKRDNEEKGRKLFFGFIIFQVISSIICIVAEKYIPLKGIDLILASLTGNIVFCEGSIIFVLLGVLLYFKKQSKNSVKKMYGIFCLVYFLLTISMGFNFQTLFKKDYQWMMIASLPFMLAYNGKKGKGYKYLFYIFYPAHIVVLFLIGNLCF